MPLPPLRAPVLAACLALAPVALTAVGPPAASVRRVSSYSRRFSSLRRTYSSTGTRNRSIMSSECRNQGRYSAECSLDSVG